MGLEYAQVVYLVVGGMAGYRGVGGADRGDANVNGLVYRQREGSRFRSNRRWNFNGNMQIDIFLMRIT